MKAYRDYDHPTSVHFTICGLLSIKNIHKKYTYVCYLNVGLWLLAHNENRLNRYSFNRVSPISL